MSEFTEAEVIRDLAFEAARPVPLEPGKRYAFRRPDGDVHEIDLRADMPARKTGYVTVTDVESFAAYYARHADEDSEVFADLDSATVTAVLDAHHAAGNGRRGEARWQQHHLTLSLRLTEPWKTWLEHDRKFMSQQAFAEFLEDNYRDLDPDGAVKAADLLEAAQQFEAVVKVEYGSGSRLQSGDVTIRRIETTEQGSGKKGYVQFPEEMDLLLKPYEDCEDASLAARLRYRVTPDGLKLGYFLNSPERVRLDAVRQVTDKAATAICAAIMQGGLG
jgi:uncharacterized protein YfdQ (DUF2303 family)